VHYLLFSDIAVFRSSLVPMATPLAIKNISIFFQKKKQDSAAVIECLVYTDGLRGPSGAVGPRGPAGEKGERGSQGRRGRRGMRGTNGIPGVSTDPTCSLRCCFFRCGHCQPFSKIRVISSLVSDERCA